jgi:hypothetical protein
MSMSASESNSSSLLQRMKEGGFDFARIHAIEFYAIFPDEERARLVAQSFRGESLNTQINQRCEGVWHLQVSKVMYASHAGIDDFEQGLETLVVPLGGRLEGWGVVQEHARL